MASAALGAGEGAQGGDGFGRLDGGELGHGSVHRGGVVGGAERQRDRTLGLDAFGVGEGDGREEEPGVTDRRDLVDRQLGREVLAVERLEVAALQADDHHRRKLVLLEFGHRRDLDVAGAHLVHEAGVDAAGEEDVGELVVADVELDRVEVAGVVDVAALRDREAALADDQLLVGAGDRRLVVDLENLRRLQVGGVLAVGLQDFSRELLGNRDRELRLRLCRGRDLERRLDCSEALARSAAGAEAAGLGRRWKAIVAEEPSI